jgi:hypothetical protein
MVMLHGLAVIELGVLAADGLGAGAGAGAGKRSGTPHVLSTPSSTSTNNCRRTDVGVFFFLGYTGIWIDAASRRADGHYLSADPFAVLLAPGYKTGPLFKLRYSILCGIKLLVRVNEWKKIWGPRASICERAPVLLSSPSYVSDGSAQTQHNNNRWCIHWLLMLRTGLLIFVLDPG